MNLDTPKRRPRLSRGPAKNVRITARDEALFRHLREHRVLRRTQIEELVPFGKKAIHRRLLDLHDARYLDVPESQIGFPRSEPRHYVYALGDKGAAHLARLDGRTLPRTTERSKNRTITQTPILHELGIADVLLSVRRACDARPGRTFVSWSELLPAMPEKTRTSRRPLRWPLRLRYSGEEYLYHPEPDACFGIRKDDEAEAQKLGFFFLEFDRGTESVERRSLASFWHQTSFFKKALAYYQSKLADVHGKRFGKPAFRVLTVAKTPERAANLAAAAHKACEGKTPNLFFFADRQAILHQDFFDVLWINTKGEEHRL